MKVKDLMVPKDKLVILGPEATIAEAARAMVERDVGSVLAVREGRLEGIFTERDVVEAVAKNILISEKLEAVMTKDVVTLKSEDYVSKAVYIVSQRGIKHIPVVDESGAPIGIVSAKDLAKYYSEYVEAVE